MEATADVTADTKPRVRRRVHCSFCNKSQDDVQKLVGGPGPLNNQPYICDACIRQIAGMMGLEIKS